METNILDVWQENSQEWVRLIQEEGIPSRKVTNQAIVNTLLDYPINKVCDIGCGEGWLVRELIKKGKNAYGVDGTRPLIKKAQEHASGNFFVQTYHEIGKGEALKGGPYDAAVLNFCIYEESHVIELLKAIGTQLLQDGFIFIQTLHPFTIRTLGKPYQNQWIEDAWKGLDGVFTSTHSWYCRTLAGWQQLFTASGLQVVKIQEPLLSGAPASIIYVLKPFK